MSRRRWIAIASVAIVLIAVVAWWRSRSASAAPKYRTAAVERGTIAMVVSATGTVQPVIQVEVGSQVSGTVYRIHADYNSRVQKDQILCEIEPSSFRAKVVQNQAAVAKARAAVKDAQRALGRERELLKGNYVSQAEVDAAELGVEQRTAEQKQAEAELQMAQVDLDHTTIRAPIDGVVIDRSIDLGQTVAASLQAPKLFVIANDLTHMQVETRIDEADIGKIHPGLPVTFTVDAYPEATFEGQVAQVRLEPVVEQGVVTYTTVIGTGNPGQRLKPGMTANVSVLVAQRDDVLKAPLAALRFRPPNVGGSRGGAQAFAAQVGGARAAADTAGRGGFGAGRRGRAPDDTTGGGRFGGRGARGGGGAGGGRRSGARGALAGASADSAGAAMPEGGPRSEDAMALKPGALYLLKAGKPERVRVMTGLSDGASVEIQSDQLKEGDPVIVGLDVTVKNANPNLQPPPGMGGRGGGGGGGRGR